MWPHTQETLPSCAWRRGSPAFARRISARPSISCGRGSGSIACRVPRSGSAGKLWPPTIEDSNGACCGEDQGHWVLTPTLGLTQTHRARQLGLLAQKPAPRPSSGRRRRRRPPQAGSSLRSPPRLRPAWWLMERAGCSAGADSARNVAAVDHREAGPAAPPKEPGQLRHHAQAVGRQGQR